jgi:hypothetical protein
MLAAFGHCWDLLVLNSWIKVMILGLTCIWAPCIQQIEISLARCCIPTYAKLVSYLLQDALMIEGQQIAGRYLWCCPEITVVLGCLCVEMKNQRRDHSRSIEVNCRETPQSIQVYMVLLSTILIQIWSNSIKKCIVKRISGSTVCLNCMKYAHKLRKPPIEEIYRSLHFQTRRWSMCFSGINVHAMIHAMRRRKSHHRES